VVRAAAAAGLRIAPQRTGHNAGPLGPLDDVVLLRTSAMTAVHVDAAAGRARVQAGTLWSDVVQAGWYARSLGLQVNSITAAEIVTADGAVHRVGRREPRPRYPAAGSGSGRPR
jgi:FAD/FMN-containing dehydrogenase